MARPAYQAIAAGDVDLDSAIKAQVARDLRPNTNHARLFVFTIGSPRADSALNTTSTSWTTLHTVRLWIPDFLDYSGIQRRLEGQVHLSRSISATGGTAEVRLEDDVSSNVSSTASSTTNEAAGTPTKPADKDWLGIDVPASWVAGFRTFNLQARVQGGNPSTWAKFWNDPFYLEY